MHAVAVRSNWKFRIGWGTNELRFENAGVQPSLGKPKVAFRLALTFGSERRNWFFIFRRRLKSAEEAQFPCLGATRRRCGDSRRKAVWKRIFILLFNLRGTAENDLHLRKRGEPWHLGEWIDWPRRQDGFWPALPFGRRG